MPPARQATIGTPALDACSSDTPRPSRNAGCTTRSRQPRIRGRSVRNPANRTRPATPSSEAAARSSPSSGPLPKKITFRSGNPETRPGSASSSVAWPFRAISWATMPMTRQGSGSPNSARNPARSQDWRYGRGSTASRTQRSLAAGSPSASSTSTMPSEIAITRSCSRYLAATIQRGSGLSWRRECTIGTPAQRAPRAPITSAPIRLCRCTRSGRVSRISRYIRTISGRSRSPRIVSGHTSA